MQATTDNNVELQSIWNLLCQLVCCLQVQGSDRTTIRAVKPKSEEADAQDSANAWPLVAEQSFAREFYHVVLNAGKAFRAQCNHSTSTWLPCQSYQLPMLELPIAHAHCPCQSCPLHMA